jgi:UDP-2,3-diacylglucosamine pyrophosphatase LpxH
MKKLQLAVISDIHVGTGARAKDLCPADEPARETMPDEKYMEKFLGFIKTHNLKADYLILPGDVTHSARPEEVEIASESIKKACAALGVNQNNVVFVPGNHDVDWSVLTKPDKTGLRWSQRYDPIRSDLFAFKAIVERGKGCVFEAPHFTIWSDPDLLVVGYNSAHHDDPNHRHHGLIDVAHIEEMRHILKTLPDSKDQLRLFLVHHHPLQYDDPTQETPDKSIMVNAEHLQTLVGEFHFDLFVHGHRHLPRFKTQSLNGSSEVAILCSGSFSVKIDNKWNGSINNLFHLITIDGRDADEQLIKGKVESWSYNYARGWVESDATYDGIPYIEPFGTYIRPESLKSLLKAILEAEFATADFVEWALVTQVEPRFCHLRPEIVLRVIDTLAPELGYKRHHHLPEKIVLTKTK